MPEETAAEIPRFGAGIVLRRVLSPGGRRRIASDTIAGPGGSHTRPLSYRRTPWATRVSPTGSTPAPSTRRPGLSRPPALTPTVAQYQRLLVKSTKSLM
jgi:hypothetical protein